MTVQDQNHEKILSELYGSNRWFRVSYDYFQVMRLEDGVFYAFLVNQDFLARRKYKSYQGWFYCSKKKIAKRFPHLDDRTETRMINRLKEKGFLSVTRSSTTPPRRRFHVHLIKFRQVLEGLDQISQNDGFEEVKMTPSSNTETLEKKSKKQTRPLKRTGITALDEYYSKTLLSIVNSKYGVMLSTRKLPGWQNEFRLLRDSVDDTDRIDKALEWFKNHKPGQRYSFNIQSAASFRKKFIAIEQAIARERKSTPLKHPSELTEEVQKLVDELKSLGWNKKDKEYLPEVVNATYHTYKDFLSRLKSYIPKLVEKYGAFRDDKWSPWKVKLPGKKNLYQPAPSNLQFAENLQQSIQGTNSFVRGWFRECHEIIQSPKWEGKLNVLNLKIDSERFTKYLSHSVQGIEKDERWEKLKEKLYAD